MFRLALLIPLFWTCLIQSAHAQGVAAQSDNFSLISDAPVDAAALLTDLEAFSLAVADDLGLPAAEPLRHGQREGLQIAP